MTPLRCAMLISITFAAGTLSSLAANTYALRDFPNSADEWNFVYQARTFALGRVTNPASPQQEHLTPIWTVIRDGRVYGKYPPGYPALLSLGSRWNVERWVNPALTGLLLSLVGLVVARLWSYSLALATTAILVSTPFFTLNGGSYFSHPTATLGIFAALILWPRCGLTESRRWLLLAATCLVLALLTRLLDPIPALFAIFVTTWWHSRKAMPSAIGALFASCVVAAILFGTYNYSTNENFLTFGYDHYKNYQMTSEPQTWGGWFSLSEYVRGAGLALVAERMRELLAVLPAAAFLVPGLVFYLRSTPTDLERRTLCLTAVFGICFIGITSLLSAKGGIRYGPRYYHPLLPFLAVALAGSAFVIAQRIPRRAVALVLIFASLNAALTWRVYGQVRETIDQRSHLFRTVVEQERLQHALILVKSGESISVKDMLRNDPALRGPIFARYGSLAENSDILGAFPGRDVYVYDQGTVVPWPDKESLPAGSDADAGFVGDVSNR